MERFKSVVLSREQYSELCCFLQLKGVSPVLPPEIYFPDFWLSCEPTGTTQFLLAAQHGHAPVVEFLVSRFCELSFLDHAGTICFSWGSKLHHCTALNAASINGDMRVVQMLLDSGASQQILDCTGSTPFCEATFHCHLDVMKCLYQHQADLNAPNDFGWNALHVAASRGNAGSELIEWLLQAGADPREITPQGYTALHIAAAVGQLRTVKLLLNRGLLPDFGPVADSVMPSCRGSVPSPLYLAAAAGYSGIVNLFTGLKDKQGHLLCPQVCEYDALLLLGTKVVETKYWRKALRFKSDHDSETSPLYRPPLSSYGCRLEIANQTDLVQLVDACSSERQLSIELHYQAMIVRERCIGENDPNLIQVAVPLYRMLVTQCLNKEAELVIFRALELMKKYKLGELENGYVLPQTIEADVGKLIEDTVAPALLAMSGQDSSNYIPSFGRYIVFGMRFLEAITERDAILRDKYGCDRIVPRYMLENVLLLFQLWLYDNSKPKSSPESQEECRALGKKLVSRWLYLKNGSTLLHLALSAPRELEGIYKSMFASQFQTSLATFYTHWTLDTLLVTSLLNWGARDVINHRDTQDNGSLPLHVAAARKLTKRNQDEALLNVLLSYGAHPDAVNAKDKPSWDACACSMETRNTLKEIICGSTARPLGCQAAMAVIRENLPYMKLPIAPRLKTFIALHDRNACMP